jgi:hypothetical protein
MQQMPQLLYLFHDVISTTIDSYNYTLNILNLFVVYLGDQAVNVSTAHSLPPKTEAEIKQEIPPFNTNFIFKHLLYC